MNQGIKQGKMGASSILILLILFGSFSAVAVNNGTQSTIPYGAAACFIMGLGAYLSYFTYPPGRLGCATDVVVIVRGILSYGLVAVGFYMVLKWNLMLGVG